MGHVASFNTVWFSLIGLLWAGYFVLEGFDFGVGVLAPFLAKDDIDHRLLLNSIGPYWDGNEVWLIVAGGATFAAFPTWYATLFSAAYLALFLILVALIVRNVTFEFRGKRDSRAWRRGWDIVYFVGSLLPALLWGVAFTDMLVGLDIVLPHSYIGGFPGLIHPIALFGGVVTLVLFTFHGAVFLSLKTTGELRARARKAVGVLAVPTILLVAGLLAWVSDSMAGTVRTGALSGAVPVILGLVTVVAVAGAAVAVLREHDGWGFIAAALAILALSGAFFSALFPRVMVSSVRSADSLTIWNAASADYTLRVMLIVAAVFTPFVLLYQGWTFWVFRQRLVRPPASPAGLSSPDGNPAGHPGGSATSGRGTSTETPDESPAPTIGSTLAASPAGAGTGTAPLGGSAPG